MIADVLSLDDERWREFLDRAPHDTYHLPAYVRIAADHEGAEPAALYASSGEHAVLIPMLIRCLPPELDAPSHWMDASSPYGYSGPIATTGIPLDVLRSLLRSLWDVARERGVVSAFLRLNPFRSIPTTILDEFGVVLKHGPVVYVDLSKSAKELWAETRGSHRDDIVRLGRMGYTVEIDDWTTYANFRALYNATMQRLSASEFYRFTDRYFDELRDLLGDHLHLCTVRGPDGEVAAGGLFLTADGLVSYHLSGTHEGHFRVAPSKLMLHVAMQWAKDRGASLFNLGGGFGGKSGSLHHFKAGFSRSELDFSTARLVFEPEYYDQLTDTNRRLRHVVTAPDAFFPLYRQTVNDGGSA